MSAISAPNRRMFVPRNGWSGFTKSMISRTYGSNDCMIPFAPLTYASKLGLNINSFMPREKQRAVLSGVGVLTIDRIDLSTLYQAAQQGKLDNMKTREGTKDPDLLYAIAVARICGFKDAGLMIDQDLAKRNLAANMQCLVDAAYAAHGTMPEYLSYWRDQAYASSIQPPMLRGLFLAEYMLSVYDLSKKNDNLIDYIAFKIDCIIAAAQKMEDGPEKIRHQGELISFAIHENWNKTDIVKALYPDDVKSAAQLTGYIFGRSYSFAKGENIARIACDWAEQQDNNAADVLFKFLIIAGKASYDVIRFPNSSIDIKDFLAGVNEGLRLQGEALSAKQIEELSRQIISTT